MAHFWARQADGHGHRVVLLPPHAVRPDVTRNKTDRADATALLEAARNEAIRPVPMKSVAQQTLTALHRLRTAWLATRTARINTELRELTTRIRTIAHQIAALGAQMPAMERLRTTVVVPAGARHRA